MIRCCICLFALSICPLVLAAPAPLPRISRDKPLLPWPQGRWQSDDGVTEVRFLGNGIYQERWDHILYTGRWWLHWGEDPHRGYKTVTYVCVDCYKASNFDPTYNSPVDYRMKFVPHEDGTLDMDCYKYGMKRCKSRR